MYFGNFPNTVHAVFQFGCICPTDGDGPPADPADKGQGGKGPGAPAQDNPGGAGPAAFYCPEGSVEPLQATAGFFTSGGGPDARTRALLLPCTAGFFCNGDGEAQVCGPSPGSRDAAYVTYLSLPSVSQISVYFCRKVHTTRVSF